MWKVKLRHKVAKGYMINTYTCDAPLCGEGEELAKQFVLKNAEENGLAYPEVVSISPLREIRVAFMNSKRAR